MNDENKSTGRTAGDTIVEILGNWKLTSIAFATLLLAFLAVINDAEPGTMVEVFGIKYQRAKPKAISPSPPPDPSTGYLLYSKHNLKIEQRDALPILDGSLAIEPRVYYSPNFGDTKPQRPSLTGGSVLGPNLSKIRIAARSHDGRPANLTRPADGTERVDFDRNSYIEIEYKGGFFSIQTEATSEGLLASDTEQLVVTVRRIDVATLELVQFDKIAAPKPSSD